MKNHQIIFRVVFHFLEEPLGVAYLCPMKSPLRVFQKPKSVGNNGRTRAKLLQLYTSHRLPPAPPPARRAGGLIMQKTSI
jgi:hypothetical protein